MLYEYLIENYEPGEPIFSGDIEIPGMSEENLRYHLKNLRMMVLYPDLSQEYTIFRKRIYLEKKEPIRRNCGNAQIYFA